MNFYLVLILTLLVGEFLLELVSDLLTLKHLNPEVPEEFKDVLGSEQYTKALDYQKEGLIFSLVRRTFWIFITIPFILLSGFNWVDQIARSFGHGPIVTGLVFTGILIFLRWLLNLPFSLYDTFILEEKFGFNKTTLKTYVTDLIKGSILGMILGGSILSGIIAFFEWAGPRGWLYSWLGFSFFQVLLLFLAPVLILPLFNKFQPLPSGELKESIESFARKMNFTLSGIFMMDSSKRSGKSNAFFTGFGKFRRLVLFDTLIEKHQVDELTAVVAHEIGHYQRKHIPKTMALSIFSTALMFYILGVFMNNENIFDAFGMENLSVYASIVFIGFLYAPILRLLSLFSNRLSRRFEFEADEYAVQTFGHPETLVSALKKLARDNLSNLTPHPLKVLLDYSHPPLLQRIQAIRSGT